MKRLTLSLFALAAALPAPTFAQDIVLDEIVITAHRVPGDARRTGVSVSIVSEADLDRRRDQTLAATLAALPGVSFTQSGPFGNLSNLRVRGADGRYLAVFVDGIRISDPSGPTVSFDFGSLTTADVGRIEVLRGSQSALWGGSAVGGVINITTRAAIEDGLHQTVSAEAGSFGTGKLTYGLTQKDDQMEMAFTLSHLRTDGFSAFDGGTEADGAKASRVSFSAKYRVNDVLSVGGAFFAQDTKQDYDGYRTRLIAGCDVTTEIYPGACTESYFTDTDHSRTRREVGARVFAEINAGSTDHTIEVAAFEIDRADRNPGGISKFSGTRLTFGYQGATTVSDALTLVYGLDWNRERSRYSNLPAGVADTRTFGAFAEALWSPTDSLDLSGAIRADRHSSFGSFQTGRLAAAWRPAEGTTIRAAVATGFRPPSVDELFGDYPDPEYPFKGNPLLTPEESLSYELGVEQEFASGAKLALTAFHLNVENLIGPDATYSSLENVSGKSTRKGVEVAGTLPLSDKATLGLAYTYTDARRPDGARLPQVARHDLTLSLDADLSDRLSAGIQIKHQAGRIDNDVNSFMPGPMPDYTVVNAAFNYALTDKADAYLRIENLGNTHYQQVNGYASSRRAVYAGISAKF